MFWYFWLKAAGDGGGVAHEAREGARRWEIGIGGMGDGGGWMEGEEGSRGRRGEGLVGVHGRIVRHLLGPSRTICWGRLEVRWVGWAGLGVWARGGGGGRGGKVAAVVVEGLGGGW